MRTDHEAWLDDEDLEGEDGPRQPRVRHNPTGSIRPDTAVQLRRRRRPEPLPPPLVFGSVADWVEDWLCPLYRRHVGPQQQYHWEPRWWESTEALVRLEAIWRAWEKLRLDPATGMAVWFRDYCDPCMAVLLSSDGPYGAADTENRRGDALPYERAPRELFPDQRDF